MRNKELLKWAGRYLESCLVRIRYRGDDDVTIVKLSPTQLECIKYGEYDSCELILKEVDHLSDEDYRKVFEHVKSQVKNSEKFTFNPHSKPVFISVYHRRAVSYTVTDLLRELGYATGISKEFYITEEEL